MFFKKSRPIRTLTEGEILWLKLTRAIAGTWDWSYMDGEVRDFIIPDNQGRALFEFQNLLLDAIGKNYPCQVAGLCGFGADHKAGEAIIYLNRLAMSAGSDSAPSSRAAPSPSR